MKRKLLALFSPVLIVSALFVTTFFFATNVFADGGHTSTDGDLAGQCGDYWDTCIGAIWRKYNLYYSRTGSVTVSSDGNDIHVHDMGHAYGGHLYNCGKVGATEYYRLGLYVYRAGRYVDIGDQAGLVRVNQIYNMSGGSGVYNLVNFNSSKSPESWSSVQADFETAKQATANSSSPITDNWSDISMFCWNPAWSSTQKESIFTSTSTVTPSGGAAVTSAPDGQANAVASTDEEEYTATFHHNIQYTSGLSDAPAGSTFPTISTTWTVGSVTADIGSEYITSVSRSLPESGTYTPPNPAANSVSEKLGETTVTFKVPAQLTVTVCQTITYSRKKFVFSNSQSGAYSIDSATMTGSSRACITVTSTADVVEEVGEDGFWGESSMKVPRQNSDVWRDYATTETVTTKDGGAHQKALIQLSTDADSLKVIFNQKMFYGDKLWDCNQYTPTSGIHAACNGAYFDDVKANIRITTTESKNGSDNILENVSGTYGTQSGDSTGLLDQDREFTMSGLQPGETRKLCQTLWHDSKKVTMARSHKDHIECGLYSCWVVHDEYHYYDTNHTGEGQTELCVEVTRPKEPEGDGPTPTPSSSASATSNLMFAGQTAVIGWTTKSHPVITRRLGKYQAIAYVLSAEKNKPYDKTKLEGNIGQVAPNRSPLAPCAWYNSKISPQEWCGTIDGREKDYGTDATTDNSDDYTPTETSIIKVPNQVGYKYCNSFGYQWEYWYNIKYDDTDNWQHETSHDYWTTYNSACRTIAKKPSTAFWNGGIMTTGGVQSSVATRFNSVSYGDVTGSTSNFDRAFGSWSEYLASVNGSVEGFASGASLSRGSTTSDSFQNSPMTIANSSASLGNSAISNNSALRERLTTYLRNLTDSLVSINNIDVSNGKTQVVSVTGNLTIQNDITLPGTATTIYQIPQVIIFVDGDVEIKPSVKRIDAWIIARGTVDTCNPRSPSSAGHENIETATAPSNAGATYSGNKTCDTQLVFNGPVIAGGVKLNRTYGSDPLVYSNPNGQYLPAEVFNLSAETYLWAYAQAGRYNSSYTEAYSRELAPRY